MVMLFLAGVVVVTNPSELLSFLGIASYYRQFLKRFSKLAATLHRLVADLVGTKSRKRSGLSFSAAWTEEGEFKS